jgi:predicted metal-dependent peptidase
MDPNIDLGSVISWLVDSSRADFFARLVMGIPTRKKRLVGACMALALTKRGYVVYWDPEYLQKATLDHVIYVIHHEMHHFILEHIPRQLRLGAVYDSSGERDIFARVTPIAVDLAADQETAKYAHALVEKIKDQPAPPMLPGIEPFEEVPPEKTYEWYTRYLADKIGPQVEEQKSKLKQLLNWLKQQLDDIKDKSEDYKRGFADGIQQAADDKKKQQQQQAGQGQGQQQGEGEQEGQEGQGQDQQPGQASGNSGGAQNSSGGSNQTDQPSGSGGGGVDQGAPQNVTSDGENQDYQDGYQDGYNQGQNAPEGMGALIRLLTHNTPANAESDMESMNIDEMLALADELEHQGQRIIRQAVDDHKKSRGTLPGHLQQYIDDLLQQAKIPWTSILRNKVINTQRFKKYRSVGRPRRRHTGIPRLMKFPGHTKERKFTVAFCIDTSGSMGTEELKQGLSELQGLQKADKDIKIHVIECDTAVGRVYEIGPNDEVKRNMTGRGGTTFDPAVIRAKELNPDIVFYFTDGYAPGLQIENRVSCPFIWVITPGGCIPDPDYGMVIATGEVSEGGYR